MNKTQPTWIAGSVALAILALSGCQAVNIGSVEKYSEGINITTGLNGGGEDGEWDVGYSVSSPEFNRVIEVAGVRINKPLLITFQRKNCAKLPAEVAGVEAGLYNQSETAGMQMGVVNKIPAGTGAQLSLVNLCKNWQGVQIGLVNVGDEWHGIQIGLVNYTPQGFVPFMIGVNWTSPKSEVCD